MFACWTRPFTPSPRNRPPTLVMKLTLPATPSKMLPTTTRQSALATTNERAWSMLTESVEMFREQLFALMGPEYYVIELTADIHYIDCSKAKAGSHWHCAGTCNMADGIRSDGSRRRAAARAWGEGAACGGYVGDAR
eukprot:795791-Pleurochrysis_carterae.AAC.2